MPDGVLKSGDRAERTTAQIRARAERPFHVVKNLFRHRKGRYRGWPGIRRNRSAGSCYRFPPLPVIAAAPCSVKALRDLFFGDPHSDHQITAGFLFGLNCER